MALTDKLTAIANAIRAKTGGSSTLTLPQMAQAIDELNPLPVEEKNVNFCDFKGNLAHSYTAAEAEALTELPEAPTIEGFTFQKWNWSLASIKTWLTKHENDDCDLNVGGLYVTTDGHTRIYMHLREAELTNLEMPFCIQQMAGTVVIDWGDGSTPETITAAGVYSHTWQVNQYPANVVIDIEYIPSGSTKLVLGRAVGNRPYGLFNNETYYAGCVEKVEFGNNIDFLTYSSTFRNCTHLREINLPDGIMNIGNSTFISCTNLALIVLPDGITSIGDYTFFGCTNLALTVLPDGVTSIGSSAFYGCANLALTVLPDGITSIGDSAFQNCTNLALTVLPDGITSIGTNAFNGCTSLYIIDLTAFTNPQSIPTLANTNALQGIPAKAQFQVSSQEMYGAFTAATNWSIYARKFAIKGAT